VTPASLTPAAFRRLLSRAVVVPPALLGALALVFLALILYLLAAARRVDHTDRVIAGANALLKLLVDGETGLRGYVITGEAVFLEPYVAEQEQVGPAFDGLAALVADNPAQAERLAAVHTDHRAWQDFSRRVIDLRRADGDSRSLLLSREGKRRMDAIRAQVGDFIRAEEDLRAARSRTALWATWSVAGVSLGLTLALGGGLAVMTRRDLVRVAADYQAALSRVEAQAESLRRSAHRLETLHGIDRAILEARPVPELIGEAIRRMGELVPAADAFVLAAVSDGGAPVMIARDGRPAEVADPALADAAPQAVGDLSAVTGRSPSQERLFRDGQRSCLAVPLVAEGERFGTLVLADPRPAAFTDDHRQVAEEVARQLAIAVRQARLRERVRRHAEELERRVEERTRELQESLRNVKQLQGLLPICAWCKKVRDDQNYWHQVDHYLSAHTATRFTHGMCPDCMQAHVSQLEQARKGSGS
jgi:CHASE3 domain sensor protein